MTRLRLRSRSGALCSCVLSCLFLALACGDDGNGEEGGVTGPPPGTSTSSDSTTMMAEDTSTGPAEDSSSGAVGSSSSGGDSTTGAAEDPAYPRPTDGNCGAGTAPVTLPGAEVCAPFCNGQGDACPDASSGDAPAACTPFLGAGGSGDPCDEMMPCPVGEACSPEGTCGEVAFWACQLLCNEGQVCPDGMVCSAIGTCGY